MSETNALKHERQQMLMARPWHAAELCSVWEVSGDYPRGGGTFTDCLAHVVWDEGDGPSVFMFMGLLALETNRTVTADQITSARRLLLVEADDPSSAYFVADQAFLSGGAS